MATHRDHNTDTRGGGRLATETIHHVTKALRRCGHGGHQSYSQPDEENPLTHQKTIPTLVQEK